MTSKEIVQLLKEKRLESNITQNEIAEHLGVDASTLSLYEAGKRKLYLDSLNRWLEFFGMRLAVVDIHKKESELKTPEQYDIERYQKIKRELTELYKESRKEMVEELRPHFKKDTFVGYGRMMIVSLLDEVESLDKGVLPIFYSYKYAGFAIGTNSKEDIENYIKEDTQMTEPDLACFDDINDAAIMEVLEKSPDVIRTINAEGFSVDTLYKIQEKLKIYFRVYNNFIQKDAFKNRLEYAQQLEEEIQQLVKKYKYSDFEKHPDFKTIDVTADLGECQVWLGEDADEELCIDNADSDVKPILAKPEKVDATQIDIESELEKERIRIIKTKIQHLQLEGESYQDKRNRPGLTLIEMRQLKRMERQCELEINMLKDEIEEIKKKANKRMDKIHNSSKILTESELERLEQEILRDATDW